MTLRDIVLYVFGLYVPPVVHDKRVHDAANREQVALSGMQISQRQRSRALKGMVDAQRCDPSGPEARQAAAELHESLTKRKDTIDVFVRRK